MTKSKVADFFAKTGDGAIKNKTRSGLSKNKKKSKKSLGMKRSINDGANTRKILGKQKQDKIPAKRKLGKVFVNKQKSVKSNKEQKEKRSKFFIFFGQKGKSDGGKKRNKPKGKKLNRNKPQNFLLVFAKILIIGLFVFFPLFFTNLSFQGVVLDKALLIYVTSSLLTFIVLLELILFRKNLLVELPFLKLFAVLIFFLLVSSWMSVDRWHSLVGFFGDPSRGLIFLLSVIFIFYMAINVLTIKEVKNFLILFSISLAILAFYTLLSSQGLIPTDVQTNIPYSLVGSLRGIVFFLSVEIFLLLLLAIKSVSIKSVVYRWVVRFLVVVTMIVVVVDLLILKDLVDWGVIVTALVVFVLLLLKKFKKKINNGFALVFLVVTTLLFLVLFLWVRSPYGYLLNIPIKIVLPKEVSAGLPISFEIVRKSLFGEYKQFLLGSGPATFGYDFAKFHQVGVYSPLRTIKYLYQGDGFMVESLPTIGLVGTLLLLVIIARFLFVIGRLLFVRLKGDESLYLLILFISFVVWLGMAFVGQVNGASLFLGILLASGMTVFYTEKSKNIRRKITREKEKTSLLSFLVIFIMSGLVFGNFYVIRLYFTDVNVKKSLNTSDLKRAQSELEKIVVDSGAKEGFYYVSLSNLFLLQSQDKTQKDENKEKVDKKKLEKAVRYITVAAELMPNDVKTINQQARIYILTGMVDRERIKEVYEHLITLEPRNVKNYIIMGDFVLKQALNNGNKDRINESIKWYSKAIALSPRRALVYDRLSKVEYLKGNIDKAIEVEKKAVVLSPRNLYYIMSLVELYQMKGDGESKKIGDKIVDDLMKKPINNIDILTNMAFYYERDGKFDQAGKVYKRIISLLGDKDQMKEIKNLYEKYLQNVEDSKSNLQNVKNLFYRQDNVANDDNEIGSSDGGNGKSDLSKQNKSQKDKMIVISVDEEGPINVRSEGSLRGKKIAKIKQTGEFKKLDEKGDWVLILIPANEDHDEIRGWVHSKFIVSK